MSSFAAAAHGIHSHHSTSTSNTSTSSISISSSYSTPSSSLSSNHNNSLNQNYQQNNLHHQHHSSNHSQFPSHEGQSPPLNPYSTDLNTEEHPSRNQHRLHHPQNSLVTSNHEDGTSNIIPLSPPISASEQKYLSSPTSSGPILPNTSNLSASTIEHLGTITPPSSSGILNLGGLGGPSEHTVSSVIQLPQTPEDPIILQQHHLTHHQHGHPPSHHDAISNSHAHNPHVSVHQRLPPTIQPTHHGNISGGNSHNLVTHQSGGGVVHTTSSNPSVNRHSNPSSPMDDDDDENIDHEEHEEMLQAISKYLRCDSQIMKDKFNQQHDQIDNVKEDIKH